MNLKNMSNNELDKELRNIEISMTEVRQIIAMLQKRHTELSHQAGDIETELHYRVVEYTAAERKQLDADFARQVYADEDAKDREDAPAHMRRMLDLDTPEPDQY